MNSLVKWLRKNNMKLMAVVIIVLMVGFVGGSALQQFLQRKTAGVHRTVAYIRNNRKVTNYDLALARQELETLKMVGADILLRNINLPLSRAPDLQAALLGELLFSDRGVSPMAVRRIKQLIRTNEYRISDEQINDIYRRSMGSNIYWLLLKTETEQAGVRVPNEQAGRLLGNVIPRLFPNTTYSQLIGGLIKKQGIPEERILATVSKLLAVLEYTKMICSNENVTAQQLMHKANWENGTIDIEFVKFDSAVFAETQGQPTEEKVAEHFNKYKKYPAGTVRGENPYGFGYKLPNMVKLEYIAVKLDDVSQIVTAPTQEEAEEYYQKHRELFTEQVLSDPNDPNSPPIERTKSYAEVAGILSKNLLQNKINSQAEKILQEAKTLTEGSVENTDTESANLSAEQLAQIAGDYKNAAEQLGKKYKIKVYAGQTGMLSATDIQLDEHLGRLYLKGYGHNPVALIQVVFAIDELNASELGPFDVQKPRMYENIGPVRDVMGQMTAVVRVIETEKTSEPESINQTFSKSTLIFEPAKEPASEVVYSVKEKVVEDVKKLTAMDATKRKADEFIKQIVQDGWEGAVEKFNELYGQQDKQEESDPNASEVSKAIKSSEESFRLQSFTSLQRVPRETIRILGAQSAGNPASQFLINEGKKEAQFTSQLCSLIPQDANTLDTVPSIMEFKPDMSYFVIKNLSVKRLVQDEYEKIKVQQAFKEDIIQSQNLAAVYFSPENILKRANIKWVIEEEKATTEANAPAESEGAS